MAVKADEHETTKNDAYADNWFIHPTAAEDPISTSAHV